MIVTYMATPKYHIQKYDEGMSALTENQLAEILLRLPISIEIADGHELSLDARIADTNEEPILNVQHGASLIVLRPQPGKRLADASFYGNRAMFVPSRIMDECTGGGACCSYSFNTWDLGLDYTVNLMLDIHKLG
jgi:hypothetical protein